MKTYKLITRNSLVVVKQANSLFEAIMLARSEGYDIVG